MHESNALKFAIPFLREGASQAIVDLTKASDLVQKYDKESEEMLQSQAVAGCSCAQCQRQPEPRGYFGLGGRGLFGNRNPTEEETIDILSLEVEKIKGILTMT